MTSATEFIATFEPLADQVLVEPIRKLERYGKQAHGLYLADNPERDKQREVFHLGRVVKCGPGDAVREGSVRPDGSRAAYAAPEIKCSGCDGAATIYIEEHLGDSFGGYYDCPRCDATGKVPGRWPMHVSPGDIVIYERRPWAVITLEGRQFLVLHEEQHVVAVVEDLESEDLAAVQYDPTLDRLVA